MSEDVRTFQKRLWLQGIEFALRKSGRLYIWPPECVKYLSVEDREFFTAHKEELKQLVIAKALPETTVGWKQPTESPEPIPEEIPCQYCGRPCVGQNHHAYKTLHYFDPVEVRRRDKAATEVMLHMLPYGRGY